MLARRMMKAAGRIVAVPALIAAFFDDANGTSLDAYSWSNPGDIQLGSNQWVEVVGDWSITGGDAQTASAGTPVASIETGLTTYLIRANIRTASAEGEYIGILMRHVDVNNNWRIVMSPERLSNDEFILQRRVSGTNTQIGSENTALPADFSGIEMFAHITPTQIIVGLDGVPILMTDSTQHAAATKAGAVVINSSAADKGHRLEDWRLYEQGIDYPPLALNIIPVLGSELRFVTYDASWAKPYRGLGIARPGSVEDTYLYESDDGIIWTEYTGGAGNPVFDNGDNYCGVGCGVWDAANSQYVIAYTGPDGGVGENVGIATTPDLINFTDLGYKITPGVSPAPPDTLRTFGTTLIIEGGVYYLMVSENTDFPGNYYRTALYHSSDLNTWIRDGVVLDVVPGSDWEDVAVHQANTRKIGSQYEMLYIGEHATPGVTNGSRCIGRAVADSITGPYVRDSSNPLIGNPGSVIPLGAPNFFETPGGDTYIYYRRLWGLSANRRWRCDVTVLP